MKNTAFSRRLLVFRIRFLFCREVPHTVLRDRKRRDPIYTRLTHSRAYTDRGRGSGEIIQRRRKKEHEKTEKSEKIEKREEKKSEKINEINIDIKNFVGLIKFA